MPYILQQDRKILDDILDKLTILQSKGELEYCIFKLMRMYMRTRTHNYSNLHDTTYAAQHCADEFRRRFLDCRESTALLENGDVY